MKAIVIEKTGGPEVMHLKETDPKKLKQGEVRVQNHAIGVNFTDIYMRSGIFPPSQLPYVPGKEGAGTVLEIGEDVTEFKPGDRVAYVESLGAYAEQNNVPQHYLVPLPDEIPFETASAMLLKGLTAQFLIRRTYVVKEGDVILVHAATGGVGQILTQWAKHLGATVIGTVGSPEKAEIAKSNGCDHVILYRTEDFAQRVRELTNGRGCDVVYDGVGKATFEGSLNSLRPLGYFVSFGLASGPIPPFNLMQLAEKGSLYATWQALPTHLEKREDVLEMAKSLFDVVSSGIVKIQSPVILPLAEAAEAHRRLEERSTTGGTILLP